MAVISYNLQIPEKGYKNQADDDKLCAKKTC